MLIIPQESFDDAPEVPESLNVTIPQSSSTRSLTDSPPVGTTTSPEIKEQPPFPSESQDEQKDEGVESETKGKKNNKKNKKKAKKDDGEEDPAEQPTEDVILETADEMKDDEKPAQQVEQIETSEAEGIAEPEEAPASHPPQKSPLLTSHRLSTASSLDEVNLTNSKEDEPMKIPESEAKLEPPPLPPKDEVASSPSPGLKGLSGSLPSLPWGPPPVNKNPPVAPPPPARKPSGPFAWFSRSSTGTKEVKSPQQSGYSRRNTANSVSTLASNLDLAARSHDGEDGDASSVNSKRPRRNSLKDQFKMLRMREEHVGTENDKASVRSGQASISQSGASPPIIPEEGEDGILAAPVAPASGATSPGAVATPSTINPTLAPGTVSGFSRSATDASVPVDWDLWQQLANDGPQALVNSEALNAAIKRGIPQTIRGVIWQILSDCRTGELEDIYRELVARGTDKDRRTPSGQVNGLAEKESTSSSRSSVRSEHSGTGTQSTSVAPSPTQETDPERLAKEQAASESARLKKAKDEATALHKLEKTIRRDLGARTSYSNYFISQGSQESLFGLCKAYALYDEAVGYAQGMNFIVMPLLFNVSSHRYQQTAGWILTLHRWTRSMPLSFL